MTHNRGWHTIQSKNINPGVSTKPNINLANKKKDSTYYNQKASDALDDDGGFITLEPVSKTEDTISGKSYNTHQLDNELMKKGPEMDINRIKELLKKGVDVLYRNDKGLSFSERAGIRGRLDIVDLISRSTYMDID